VLKSGFSKLKTIQFHPIAMGKRAADICRININVYKKIETFVKNYLDC